MFLFRKRKPRKVFGLGLSRTGTTSLDRALRSLGYRVQGYDPALLEAWASGNTEPVLQATLHADAFQDWPFPLAFREIINRFGHDASYVLTVRASPEVWFRSYTGHAERKGNETARYRQMAFGYADPRGKQAEHIAFYEAHNAAVRAAIAEQHLEACFAELCWERGDGWKELCGLTGDTVPRGAFPHSNRRPEPA